MISDSHNAQSEGAQPSVAAPPRLRRRRFVGAAGGLGVLLAVQARTALGQGTCESPSAMLSGNTSPREGEVTPCAGGFSPGFWKQPQHEDMWTTASAAFPQFTVMLTACTTGQKALSPDLIADPGTLVTTVFPNAPGDYEGIGLWQALAFPNDFGDGLLMRHLICAWLNAGAVEYYPLTQEQVEDMQSQLSLTGYYCPNGIICKDSGWSAEQVASYIEGMYDLETSYVNEMCAAEDKSTTTPGGKGGGGGGKSKKS